MIDDRLKQMYSFELLHALINDISLARKFDELDLWKKINSSNWCNILLKCPQFADRCDKWAEIGWDEWLKLLFAQPQFADKCSKWTMFSLSDWVNLLSLQPQFADRFDENYAWERANIKNVY